MRRRMKVAELKKRSAQDEKRKRTRGARTPSRKRVSNVSGTRRGKVVIALKCFLWNFDTRIEKH